MAVSNILGRVGKLAEKRGCRMCVGMFKEDRKEARRP